MKTAAFAALIALALATGCRHLHSSRALGTIRMEAAGQLSVDMPKDEALKLLGPPESLATRLLMFQNDWKAHEVLRYRMGGSTNYFVVIFRDAKVTEYGPLVGERAMELAGLFEQVVEPQEPGAPVENADGIQP